MSSTCYPFQTGILGRVRRIFQVFMPPKLVIAPPSTHPLWDVC